MKPCVLTARVLARLGHKSRTVFSRPKAVLQQAKNVEFSKKMYSMGTLRRVEFPPQHYQKFIMLNKMWRLRVMA